MLKCLKNHRLRHSCTCFSLLLKHNLSLRWLLSFALESQPFLKYIATPAKECHHRRSLINLHKIYLVFISLMDICWSGKNCCTLGFRKAVAQSLGWVAFFKLPGWQFTDSSPTYSSCKMDIDSQSLKITEWWPALTVWTAVLFTVTLPI